MSKAVGTLLLTLILMIVSGVTNKTFALEKLTTISLNDSKKEPICSPLRNFILTSNAQCEMKIISQRESVAKLESKSSHTFSYATEPTYFDPTPAVATEVATSATLPTQAPTITQAPANNMPASDPNNNSDYILELINAHRAKIGKPSFAKEASLCSIAQARSLELHGELFEGKGYLHSGLYNRNLPYWITENAKYGSDEAGTVQWWLNSPIHRSAIEGNYTYSCGACNGTQCSQLFTSYTPKASAVTSPNVTQTLAVVK